jgi:hypothetical protein
MVSDHSIILNNRPNKSDKKKRAFKKTGINLKAQMKNKLKLRWDSLAHL